MRFAIKYDVELVRSDPAGVELYGGAGHRLGRLNEVPPAAGDAELEEQYAEYAER